MLVLNVATQAIKTEINIQKASLDSQTTMPQIKITTEAAKVEIHQPNGELTIDQTKSRYAMGIKNIGDLCRDNGQDGKQAAIEAVGRIAEDGNRLARIESKEYAVVEMAADKNISEQRELTLASIPRPEISYKRNPPQINVTDAKLDIVVNPRESVEGKFHPGKVELRVIQYPSIKMWISENKVDMMM